MADAWHHNTGRPARALAACAARAFRRVAHASALLLVFTLLAPTDALAQKGFTKEYPAASNVRLFLVNRSGTIEVIAWERNKVKVSARMESSSTRVVPQVSNEEVTIDVERENREDKGDVNFTIYVPAEAAVDIQTKRGNIIVRNVRGAAVQAHVSTEGDIELTGIRAVVVNAKNIMGNILFDAELLSGGTYVLESMQGDIQLRINAADGFRLTATAPRTRNINLGGFAGHGQFEFTNDKRKVIGKVGNGGAILNTTNTLGSIVIAPRTR